MIKVLILFLSVASSLGLDGDSIRAQNATISDRDELFTVIDLNKRRLSSTTASIGTFLPLDCNSELSSADCGTNKVSTIIVGGAPLTIPCGECWEWDIGNTTVDGINIEGKLVFPTNHKAVIRTSSIIVQGELQLSVTHATISPENESIIFILTGNNNINFIPAHQPNNNVCGAGGCDLGKKPFLVAGGKINIDALGDECKTWTQIKDKVLAKPIKDPNDFSKFETLPGTCPVSGINYIDVDFKNSSNDLWSCRGDCDLSHDVMNNVLMATNRTQPWHGPRIDITSLLPRSCLLPDRDYLFTARIKLDKTDGSMDGLDTTCKSAEDWFTSCPSMYTEIYDANTATRYIYRRATLAKPYAGKYGEFVDFTSSFKFSSDELSLNGTFYNLFIDGPEVGVDISIDSFRISLPGQSSFPSQTDVCSDMIFNGDAEGNGMNPYPATNYYWDDRVLIAEENGNKFYRLKNRNRYSSSITFLLNPLCFDPGVIYFATFKSRIHSEENQAYHFQLIFNRPDGSWASRRILECPGHKFTDGWRTCSGEFMIDEELARGSNIKLNMYMLNQRDGHEFTVDTDDMQIRYHRGMVKELVLKNEDISCWGAGTGIHITSSIFYNHDTTVKKNGYVGKIEAIEAKNDGTYVTLVNAPTVPIITELENSDFAASVGLLSRNVKIEGDYDEVENKKGGYMQILHTPSTVQTIKGVEFNRMGRQGETDRFALQLVYNGELEGSLLSHNSFRESFQRCISVEGTSNITISHNIGYNTEGHCIYVKWSSQFNLITHNLVSETYRIDRPAPDENDNYAIAFYIRFSPNDIVMNKATGGRYHGFVVYHDWRLKLEDGTWDNSVNPRFNDVGLFKNNDAYSNADNGIVLVHLQQDSRVQIENCRALKNRWNGLDIYGSHRLDIINGVFAENNININLKWSENLNMIGSTIIGYLNATKEMVTPPYFKKRCTSEFLTTKGIRMQTALKHWETHLNPLKKGIALRDVNFTDFDHDDECKEDSVAIMFNTDDKSDGHFNYMSAFKNVNFNGLPFIDARRAALEGIRDIVIEDIDGSSDPSGQASQSSFVSSNMFMTKFAPSACTSYVGSISYCPNYCTRTLAFVVDQSETFGWNLKITRTQDGVQNFIPATYMYDDDFDQLKNEANGRKFYVTLPSGPYQVQFLDTSNQVAWPTSVEQRWGGVPECTNHANASDLIIIEPEDDLDCNDLIRNGDIEDETKFWLHFGGKIELISGGLTGSSSLKHNGRKHPHQGPGQKIDTRCIRLNHGKYYELKAWYKLEKSGVPVSCGSNCPRAKFKTRYYEDPATKEKVVTEYPTIGYTVKPYRSDQFSLIHQVLKVDDKLRKSHELFFYIEPRAENDIDIIIDNVSMTPISTNICSGDLIRNGDFETGYAQYWERSYSASMKMIEVGHNSTVLFVYDRSSSWNIIRQYLYVDCLSSGNRYAVLASYAMEDINGNTVKCDLSLWEGLLVCSNMNLAYSGPDGSAHIRIAHSVAVASGTNNGWNLMAGIFTVQDAQVNHDSLYVYTEGTHTSYNLFYDNVKITPIPKDCQNLVINPTFDDGTSSFWLPRDRGTAKVIEMTTGSGNSGYATIYAHDWVGNSLRQQLDSTCFVKGQQYEISGKFRLLDRADLTTPLTCSPGSRNWGDEEHCPFIHISGEGCDGSDEHLTFWNSIPFFTWNPNIFNDFKASFFVTNNLASCRTIYVLVGHRVPVTRAVVIDDIQISQLTTSPPTQYPTNAPTQKKEPTPTIEPTRTTSAPTVGTVISCPPTGSPPIEVDAGQRRLTFASLGKLCILCKAVLKTDGSTIKSLLPVARSYDTNAWEVSAGELAESIFYQNMLLCASNSCQVTLPDPGVDIYLLISFSHTLSERDEYARFLETATFGVTTSELNELQSINSSSGREGKITKWIERQMDPTISPITSHRMFWRARASPRLPIPEATGVPDHPCNALSRWRKFAFVRNDALTTARNLRVSGNGPYTLYHNSHPRTIVHNFTIEEDPFYSFDPNFDYKLCQDYWGIPVQRVGGTLCFYLENGTKGTTKNPVVDFSSNENLPSLVVNLPNDPNILRPIDEISTGGEEFILMTGLDDPVCQSISSPISDVPIFGKLPDNTWLQFDPRLGLKSNTISDPIPDGGKAERVDSTGVTYCSNAPRTFLNEDQCELSSGACRSISSSGAIEITLDNSTIAQLHTLSGRYIYSMNGLVVKDNIGAKLQHPCTGGLRSRWEAKPIAQCSPSDVFSGTLASLTKLISDSNDPNPFIRDIHFPSSGLTCNATDTNPEIELEVDGQCWTRVHHDHLSIYDLSYWVTRHPGGPKAITKWSDNGGTTIIFPSNYQPEVHPMARWDSNFHKFTYVGRFADKILLRDLPSSIKTDEVLQYYDSDQSSGDDSGVLVCGSPNEEATDKEKGFLFDVKSENGFSTNTYSPSMDREIVWTMATLDAQDQLRQRVAWALAQLLVVVKIAIGNQHDHTEMFLTYYDIFVRNAFGNYRDILKEISYSSLMAENLSFLGSKSATYVWERYRVKASADENFAREIMQLFTMGLIKLKPDGTPALDSNGNKILTYTNDDIMSLSRAWTGFDLQNGRGNIEGMANRMDPMKIQPTWRDKFPKSHTENGYIGDNFPLCIDLPSRHFLRKGARYRFLGSSSLPEMVDDPPEYATDNTIQQMVLSENSNLRTQLCNVDRNGSCQYMNTVILPTNLNCVDNECNVDTLRVVKVAENMFYEYVQYPCVQEVFYQSAKKINQRQRTYGTTCANPLLAVASEACCSLGSTTATRNYIYDGERLTFASAKARCVNDSKNSCDFSYVSGDEKKLSNFFWTSDDCLIRVKVRPDGMAALVYEPSGYTQKVSHIADDNDNFFRVYWDTNGYPTTSQDACGGVCDILDDGSCLCGTSITKDRVFSDFPRSVAQAQNDLYIGAFDPEILDGTYSSDYDSETGITTYRKGGRFDIQTIFKLTDDKGRTLFMKNMKQKVNVLGVQGAFTGYSFRNPLSFMDLITSEATIRDAQYETDATLDHYFYHDNTPPFLALRFIQRFVVSNPTPRYVKSVADAFKAGIYSSNGSTFGGGKYGDMSSTIAAIFLDREARNVVLDKDPSYGLLREPILKTMALMKSMEFNTTSPKIMLNGLESRIGQMAHEFPSVFSFFLPEFQPVGRIGDAKLVAPEAMLLDMPKITGLITGMFSLVTHGLSACYGGFGLDWQSRCTSYLPEAGVLTYKRPSSDENFSFDTFEGPSLKGGLDNVWIGRHYWNHNGKGVKDPIVPGNHVLHFTRESWYGELFSPILTLGSSNYIVKFRYYSAFGKSAGGCIGYTEDDFPALVTWVWCDSNQGLNRMESQGAWISCQFELPQNLNQTRISVADRAWGGQPDAYFDDIQFTEGNGTTCDGVTVETKTPPGKAGHSSDVVDEVATLLTAGRLSTSSRQLIAQAYDDVGGSELDGLRIAQKLILTSSEFHTTNMLNSNEGDRTPFTFPDRNSKPYKAVVMIMFNGGCDSFNMLVPHTCSNKLYDQYFDIRQQVAIPKGNLLPISASGQVCSEFGIHPDLTTVRDLYQDNDLLFFANTGVMTKMVNKEDFGFQTKTQLFAHNTMQKETQRQDPLEKTPGSGVLGRISDVLTSYGSNVGSFSIDRFSTAVNGIPGISSPPIIVGSNGVPPVYISENIESLMKKIHNSTDILNNGFFSETWSNALLQSLDINYLLGAAFENATTTTEFPETAFGQQLEAVAKLIATRSTRGVDKDFFYVDMGGYDTHASVEENLSNLFKEVNSALKAFTSELKAMSVWNNVTTIQVSDFARTLNPNSGDGTDHAWGGNYMMFGGNVKGGEIKGKYPEDLTLEGELILSRGRVIPTTPWDACFRAIALSLGVEGSDLAQVCPNCRNFPSSTMFRGDELFNDVEPLGPTASPTETQTTNSPTDSPTKSPTLTTSPTLSPTYTSNPTNSLTLSPTSSPTKSSSPTTLPTSSPTSSPTNSPISSPTSSPTNLPTSSPTSSPTNSPTSSPTSSPTNLPTSSPTSSPTNLATSSPTSSPTNLRTSSPTFSPTNLPTSSPTNSPTETLICNHKNKIECIMNGCVYINRVCKPCSDFGNTKKNCERKKCIWQPGKKNKPNICMSCNDLTGRNACLKKLCAWNTSTTSCSSCSIYKNESCWKAKCAQINKKSCVPCQNVKTKKKCTSFKIKKGCKWKNKKCIPK